MKANAPEKIYMTPSYGEPDNVLLASFSKSHLDFHRDIEYVCTDAFIDKALAYLNEKFYFNNLHNAVENNTFHCMEEMFDDFRNYMKGE